MGRTLALLLLLALAPGGVTPTGAATITVINGDGAGEGFNDATVVSPVGGNSGTTLGAQRLNAFTYAATLWGAQLTSSVTIKVDATMDVLTCSSVSAVLGSAGANTIHYNFTNAPYTNTYYPQALANKIAGTDLTSGYSDIVAYFNSAIGTTCSFPKTWYYGLDGNPGALQLDFVTVVLHELGHGLGFQTYVDETTGQRYNNRDDIFMKFLEDHSLALMWTAMTDAQRATSAKDDADLHWTGSTVVAASSILTAGRHASGHVQMYAPNPAEPGSSVSHFSTACSPNELMEPIYTGPLHAVSLARHVMTDIGWGTEGGAPTTTSTTGIGGTSTSDTVSTSSSTTTTIPFAGPCPPSPIAPCSAGASQRGTMLIRSTGSRRTLRWKLVHGAGGDLGDPVAGSPLVRICLYDTSAVAQPVALLLAPPGGTCGKKACWKHLGANGLRYRDPTGTPDGLTDMKLKVAATGELQLLAKGKGGSLPLPPMPLVAPVTVQLAIGEGAGQSCWQAVFTSTLKSDGAMFKAKTP